MQRRSSILRQIKPWGVSRWPGHYVVLASPWLSVLIEWRRL